jgi:hypothetical protein
MLYENVSMPIFDFFAVDAPTAKTEGPSIDAAMPPAIE